MTAPLGWPEPARRRQAACAAAGVGPTEWRHEGKPAGTPFVAVELSWEEYERLHALGARRLEFSLRGRHKLVIEDGCELLVGGRCAIYEHRPEICRRFICDDGAGCDGPPVGGAGTAG